MEATPMSDESFALGEMIPALDVDEDVEYVWYLGDPVPTIGLWKRSRGSEVSIYQNTRGKGVFNGVSISAGDADATDPTVAFWDALNELVTGEGGGIDVEGCEWYEIEFLDDVVDIGINAETADIPAEVGRLFSIAQERGGEDE